MPRSVFLLERFEFRPMVSTAPLRYLEWLTNYKREDEERSDATLESGMSLRSNDVRLLGAFYAIGITGHQQFRCYTIMECANGWDGGWRQMMGIYERVQEKLFLSDIDGLRWEAFSRPLVGAFGCPTLDQLIADEVKAPYFMFEDVTVRPGAALDYLEAVRSERAPVLAEYGFRPAGLYEVAMTDSEACVLWAGNLDGHVAMNRAYDAALGLDDGVRPDQRLVDWRRRSREFLTGTWRETLLAPYPGTHLSPWH